MGVAGGIDLGGTKIEAQRFDRDWNITDKRRISTPASYADLVGAVADQVAWLRQDQKDLPVGIAAAGMVNPITGNWIAANLSADGKPFVNDVAEKSDTVITWLNDCRAFTQAEAIFGAGSKNGTMVGLVLGTGIAGGVAINGRLINDGKGQSGEFGHLPISGAIFARHILPAIQCGCGRVGCYETYGSGPGMQRLAEHFLDRSLTTREIVSGGGVPAISPVCFFFSDTAATVIYTILNVVDPRTIVLGGGLSQIPGLIDALETHLERIAWDAFPLPSIRLGTRGETAAALGAAYTSWQVRGNV